MNLGSRFGSMVMGLGLAALSCGVDEQGAPRSEPDPRMDAAVAVMDCIATADCHDLFVVAHRGEHLRHPENSLAGLRAAAEMGVDMVEIDVRHTADEVLVLMHDADVDRTTDGSGEVAALTWAEIAELALNGGDPADPESARVPSFDATLALARELGVALYLDQKTERADLVVAEVMAGAYQDVVLLRDDVGGLATAVSQAPDLLVMPPVSSEVELDQAQAAIADLQIVEVASVDADPALTALVSSRGLVAQQDVMAVGDALAFAAGDYSGWGSFVEAGVSLMQTNQLDLLLPAVWSYRASGVFPASGPAGQ